jgi:hypothetical protein
MTDNDSTKIWLNQTTYIDLSMLPEWWFFIGLGISLWIQNLVIIGGAALHFFPEIAREGNVNTTSMAIQLFSIMQTPTPAGLVLTDSHYLSLLWWMPVIIGIVLYMKRRHS